MSKSDVEMVEKLLDDSGNNIQESERKLMDPNVEREVEAPCATAASGDVNGRDHGGEDLNERRDEDTNQMNLKAEVKEQTNAVTEVSEQIEGSDCGIMITKSANKEVINTAAEAEAQTDATGAVEIQKDNKNEVAEPEAANSWMKDESTKNDVVDGNHGVDVEKPNEEVLEKKPKEIGHGTENIDHVEGEAMVENAESGAVPEENSQLTAEFSANKNPQGQDAEVDDVCRGKDEGMADAVHFDQDMVRDEQQGVKTSLENYKTDRKDTTLETAAKPVAEESSTIIQHEASTPFVRCSSAKAADHSGETSMITQATLPMMGEDDDGTPEDQATFMKELEHFYRERTMDFKPPKFYGQPLNCLKLWKAVTRLGGYDRVTGSKLWRQVGESFHPPKTCTTVSWTFRIFYEKSLLEYERYKTQSGELQLPIPMLPELSGGDVEGSGPGSGSGLGSGSGRARRDAASRAMQGWHAQHLAAGEVGEPIVKDKNLNYMAKNEKNLKSICSPKQKRPNEVEHSNKAARTDISKQLVASIVDVGSPADWVKINVRQTKECFEVYALVPGLLREEVRVQSDPAGRLVITGQPEQVDNPWGITPFKKVISLPARIDPVQTSAVVSMHGRLLVRVPFEQPNM